MQKLAVVGLACVGSAEAFTLAQPPLVAARHRASSAVTMGAFDDMMKKVADREAAPPPAEPLEPAETRAPAGPSGSLASRMFGSVMDGFNDAVVAAGGGKSEEEAPIELTQDGKNNAMANAIDERAQTGDVTFTDFLAMSEAYLGMGGKQVPGMPQLSASQLLETREKFQKHEKIVNVMLDEERDNVDLLMDDLKKGGTKPGPRVQRLAQASGESEPEVALFLMQFEAMRESTKRIAAGEDPDEVNASMSGTGPGANRAAKRAAKKKEKKAKKKM